jgi:P-type conjugative transfer protein TrbL
MNAQILNTITAAFVDAIQSGTQVLAGLSLILLGVLGIIAFYYQVSPLVASGSAGVGDALAGVLFVVIKTGVFYFLLLHLPTLAVAAYQTFLQWGMAPGGDFAAGSFLDPAAVVDLGFAVAGDIYDAASRLSLVGRYLHPFLLWGYSLAYWLSILSFAFVALHLMMTIIEYNLAVLVGTVLIPWGVLQPTAFFSEFSIGWLTGGLVRILVTASIVGIGRPLFRTLTTTISAGGDPTFYSSAVIGIASFIFAVLAWVVPGRAAAIAGRGVSLALHGGTLLEGASSLVSLASSPLRGFLIAQQAIRGVSQLVPRG